MSLYLVDFKEYFFILLRQTSHRNKKIAKIHFF